MSVPHRGNRLIAFHFPAVGCGGPHPEDFLAKPPSRSAPRGTSAKQAPAPKAPKPARAKPAQRPERAEAKRNEKPERARTGRPAHAKAAPRAEQPEAKQEQRTERARTARPPRQKPEKKLSPSRANRTKAYREQQSGERPMARAAPTLREPRLTPPPREARAEAPAPHRPGEPQRIAKLLARAGIASRREIERMIAEGRIAKDGAVLDTPATVLTSLKGVTVDGKPVSAPAETRLFLFHKPPGFLTAANDPGGRKTIYDRLPQGLPRLVPVGRLDLNTEGLLLLTNDGEFKRQLELPSSGVERTYRARVFGEISQEQLEELIQGIEIEGMRYGSIDANLERRTGRNAWVEMKLTEGKNREVRRVLEHLGLQVSRLIRTAYGPFVLADLPSGGVVEVRQHELVEFRKRLNPSRHGEGDHAQHGGGGSGRGAKPPPPHSVRSPSPSRGGSR